MMAEELVEKYAQAAEAHGAATARGDHKAANRAHDRVIRALKALRKTPEREFALVPLLKHESPSVRVWAATYLLPLDEAKAAATLQELASLGRGFVSLDAEMVLKLWRKGELRLL